MPRCRILPGLLAVLVMGLLGPIQLQANPVVPGDPFATIPGTEPDGTFLGFGAGVVPPIPPDFFGPGSDPFIGEVLFLGQPVDPGFYGDASTLVLRDESPVYPGDPVGTMGEVPIEIVALDLVSTQPIIVTYNGGQDPEEWEVRVLLSGLTPPLGSLFATKTHENGGVFEMSFAVQPLFVFTRVLDGNQEVLDTGLVGMDPLEFVGLESHWVHEMSPDLDFIVNMDGLFVPGVIEVIPGDPTSQEGVRIHAEEITGAARHTVFPPLPILPPDPHATISGLHPDGTFVRFGFGAIPPLPADYFGPGSDPFEGQIALDGNPFDPPNLGDTSTLAQRDGQPIVPFDPPGTMGEVQIQIVQLDLVSADPIVVTYDGGQDPEPWDVQVLLSETEPPPGFLLATKTHPNGGTFDSTFRVQPLFVFRRVADGELRFLDTAQVGLPPLEFAMLGAPWVHDLNPLLDVIAPSDGWFVPGIEEVIPGDPSTQELRRMYADEFSGAARHTIFPPRPIGTAVGDSPAIPLVVRSFPNPFNPSTRIEFTLPRDGQVEVGIYDLTGRLVNRLVAKPFGAGTHSVQWHGTDGDGGPVASGVYLYRVIAPGATATEKISLVK